MRVIWGMGQGARPALRVWECIASVIAGMEDHGRGL